MANKKQTITTKLDAESKGLNDALNQAQDQLKKTGAEAEKAAKKVAKSLSGSTPKGLPKDLGKGVENAIGQGLTKVLGAGGPGAAALQGGVKAAFSAGAGLALPAVGLALAGLAKKFGDSLNENIKQKLDISSGAERHTGGDTDLYQMMQSASKKTGASIDTLSTAYKRFGDTLEKAKQGNLDAIESLAKLGYRAKDFSEGSAGFLEALAAIGTATDRDAVAMAIFGTNTAEAMKAFSEMAGNADSLDGIIGQDAIANAQRLTDAWAQLKASMGDFFEPLESGWNSLIDSMISGTADVLEGLAAAVDMPKELSGSDLDAELQKRRDDLARRQAARREAEAARQEEARRKRNEEADRKTAQYQEQLQREELRRHQQRQKITEEYTLAGMSETERRRHNRRKYTENLVAQGFNPQEAEAITKRLYDAKHQATPQTAAAPSMPSRASARLPQNAPMVATNGVGLDAILRAILDLKANTYVVK